MCINGCHIAGTSSSLSHSSLDVNQATPNLAVLDVKRSEPPPAPPMPNALLREIEALRYDSLDDIIPTMCARWLAASVIGD